MKHVGNIRSEQNYAQEYLDSITEVSGDVRADQGATITLPAFQQEKIYHEIADDGYYKLCRSGEDTYVAGCRGSFTKDEALAHWNRTDERAVIFTAAIKKAEGI